MDGPWCCRHPLSAELWDVLQGCTGPGFCSGLGGSWRLCGVVIRGPERAESIGSSPPDLAFQGWTCSDEGHWPPSTGLRALIARRGKRKVGDNYSKTRTAATAMITALTKPLVSACPFLSTLLYELISSSKWCHSCSRSSRKTRQPPPPPRPSTKSEHKPLS